MFRTSTRGKSLLAGAAAISLFALPGLASAKDLAGRLGAGYTGTLPGTTGGASVRYWTGAFGLQGDLGFMTVDPEVGESDSSFVIGLSGLLPFVSEENLSLYGQAGIDIGSVADETAFAFNIGAGTEFFLQGLPNLGLCAGVGFRYLSISDTGTVFALAGGDFATFGIRYYFGGGGGVSRPAPAPTTTNDEPLW